MYRENIVQFYRDVEFNGETVKETIVPISICDLGYFISNYGNVYSIKNKRLKQLTPCPTDKYGHLVVNLMNKGKVEQHYVHYLVVLTFVGKRPSKMDIRHLNGKPWDNSLDNLEYGTKKENAHDAILHGTSSRGSKNAASKLTEHQVIEMRSLFKTGKFTKKQMGEMFGISRKQAGDIINNKNWAWLNDNYNII